MLLLFNFVNCSFKITKIKCTKGAKAEDDALRGSTNNDDLWGAITGPPPATNIGYLATVIHPQKLVPKNPSQT